MNATYPNLRVTTATSHIRNRVAVVAKFDRAIALDVVHFGAKKFGVVARQTRKRGWLVCDSRFALLAQLQSRYVGGVANYSTVHTIYINPKSVAHFCGIEMALDLLLMSGFVSCAGREASITTTFIPYLNQ